MITHSLWQHRCQGDLHMALTRAARCPNMKRRTAMIKHLMKCIRPASKQPLDAWMVTPLALSGALVSARAAGYHDTVTLLQKHLQWATSRPDQQASVEAAAAAAATATASMQPAPSAARVPAAPVSSSGTQASVTWCEWLSAINAALKSGQAGTALNMLTEAKHVSGKWITEAAAVTLLHTTTEWLGRRGSLLLLNAVLERIPKSDPLYHQAMADLINCVLASCTDLSEVSHLLPPLLALLPEHDVSANLISSGLRGILRGLPSNASLKQVQAAAVVMEVWCARLRHRTGSTQMTAAVTSAVFFGCLLIIKRSSDIAAAVTVSALLDWITNCVGAVPELMSITQRLLHTVLLESPAAKPETVKALLGSHLIAQTSSSKHQTVCAHETAAASEETVTRFLDSKHIAQWPCRDKTEILQHLLQPCRVELPTFTKVLLNVLTGENQLACQHVQAAVASAAKQWLSLAHEPSLSTALRFATQWQSEQTLRRLRLQQRQQPPTESILDLDDDVGRLVLAEALKLGCPPRSIFGTCKSFRWLTWQQPAAIADSILQHRCSNDLHASLTLVAGCKYSKVRHAMIDHLAQRIPFRSSPSPDAWVEIWSLFSGALISARASRFNDTVGHLMGHVQRIAGPAPTGPAPQPSTSWRGIVTSMQTALASGQKGVALRMLVQRHGLTPPDQRMPSGL